MAGAMCPSGGMWSTRRAALATPTGQPTCSTQLLYCHAASAAATRRHAAYSDQDSSRDSTCCRSRCGRCCSNLQRLRVVSHAEPASVTVGDLTPYILWDTHLMVSAAWHAQLDEADLGPIRTELLNLGAQDITFMRGARRQGALRDDGPVMALSATCRPEHKEALVAGVLAVGGAGWAPRAERNGEVHAVTPAAEVRLFPCERAYLPTKALDVDTPFGTVNVDVELAGSTVVGVRADAECCEQLARSCSAGSAAGTGRAGVTAQDVADSAREMVKQGLEQGNISLGLEFLY